MTLEQTEIPNRASQVDMLKFTQHSINEQIQAFRRASPVLCAFSVYARGYTAGRRDGSACTGRAPATTCTSSFQERNPVEPRSHSRIRHFRNVSDFRAIERLDHPADRQQSLCFWHHPIPPAGNPHCQRLRLSRLSTSHRHFLGSVSCVDASVHAL